MPDPVEDLGFFIYLLRNGKPFTYIRFSDGESEVLHGGELRLGRGKTRFQGRTFTNSFAEWDTKTFIPEEHVELRSDLIRSALYFEPYFFKGIATSSNNRRAERFMMERWNKSTVSTLTFADLLVNENYPLFLAEFLPSVLESPKPLVVICNASARFEAAPAQIIHVPSDFFLDYKETLDATLTKLTECARGSIVLSSASSLSNILGHRLKLKRPDITFLDVGTSINHLLGFSASGRHYLMNSEPKDAQQREFCLDKRSMKIYW